MVPHLTTALNGPLLALEAKFLSDMQSKYDLNGSFTWLTQKQRTTLEKILAKYGRI